MTAHELPTGSLRPEIHEAMKSVAEAGQRLADDPARPQFHYLPPAHWMNDPNGTIYHNGVYHLFYQHNPFADTWGDIHWGHAQSTDLVHWQDLPIALWPSQDLGEGHCFSGCAAVNSVGEPLLFYTSVGSGESGRRPPNQQWIATGNAEWTHWQKHPNNPFLALGQQGVPQFDPEWRDPFIFAAGSSQFMVLGATMDDMAGVALFESVNARLLEWRYRGWLFQRPCAEIRFFECPNFFALGDKWILLTSPYTPIQYMVGAFDTDRLVFQPDFEGTLDHGASGDTPNFYASNIFWGPEGDCIVVGWVRGFPPDQGWNGCLSIPRLLTLGADGRPRQRPVPQMHSLRQRETRKGTFEITNPLHMPECSGTTFECQFTAKVESGSQLQLVVGSASEPLLTLTDQVLTLAGTTVELGSAHGKPIDIHLFLDRSVAELFACDGALSITRLIPVPDLDAELQLSSTGEPITISDFVYWQLQ